MAHRNVALYNSIKSYLPVAIALLVKKAEGSGIGRTQGKDGFQWARLLKQEDLAKLPEYKKCIKEVNNDPAISRHLETLVSISLGGSRMPDAEGLMYHLLDLGLKGDRYVFDEGYFELEYATFEESFYGDGILFEVVAYLQGLMIEKSVRLSDDLELSLFTENEINSSPDLKIRKGSKNPALNASQLCAVRTWYSLKKVIGDHPTPTLEAINHEREIQYQANARIDEVINALRLVGIVNVYYYTIIHRTAEWLPIGPYNFPGRFLGEPSLWFQQNEAWVGSFRQFWLDLQNEGVKKRKFLDIAITRFSYGHERHRLEDRVLDLFIAAEALFMSEGEYIGELNYRLSERAALFIGGTDMTLCRKVFRHMKAAYGLRSAIAHGNTPNQKKFPNKEDGSKMNLDEFVWTIHEYMRMAIHKALKLAIQPNTPHHLVNWEELVFSKGEDHTQM
jgi:hypothetical protein